MVTIGILIALQINTWNETRKQNNARNQFIDSMLLELQKDSIFLQSSIEILGERINTLNDIKNRINDPISNLDTLDNIMKHEYDPSFQNPIGLNKNTFSTLASSGQISLFDNEDADKI